VPNPELYVVGNDYYPNECGMAGVTCICVAFLRTGLTVRILEI